MALGSLLGAGISLLSSLFSGGPKGPQRIPFTQSQAQEEKRRFIRTGVVRAN